jgi:23S rRNA (pseudouridine1915-N3)-methyltransferase
MRYKIIAFGKEKNSNFKDSIAEYHKRLAKNIQLIELENKDADKANILDSYISKDNFNIFLDANGQNFTSEGFAEKLSDKLNIKKKICFFIGPDEGFSRETIKNADLILSFGKMTYPHILVRLILLEQIYRSIKIQENHPYHK